MEHCSGKRSRFGVAFLVALNIFGAFPTPAFGVQINYQLSQPQIYIENGNIYIIPAQGKNLVLASNAEGKILFNEIEMRSLVASVQNSSRDLEGFKRIFGSPSNTSAGLSQRIASLEETMIRLSLVDQLDTRLTNVERQIMYNTSSPSTTDEPTTRRSSVNNRLRRLTARVAALEARGGGSAGGSNPCASNPCLNGGSCIPTAFGPFCWCREGWEGPNCDQDVNECANFAGTDLGCQNLATCRNRPGGYDCDCRPGWMGLHCTKRAGDCSSGPAWELCGHGACINQQSGGRPFICICDQGWKTDGSNPACNIDVNECDTGHALCSTNPPVTCINTPGSYMCGPCPQGYTGNGHRCMDINECLVGNGGCSMNPMVQCINTPGSRSCGECPPGYIGNGMTCQYVGLCAVNNGGCHPMSRCVENPVIGQSYVQCLCPAGMTGTGLGLHGCYPVPGGGGGGSGGGSAIGPPSNPCSPNPCSNSGICHTSGNNGFSCFCFNGWSGPTCNTRHNPCMVQGSSTSPCQNGGSCTERPGSSSGFICTCLSDYTGDLCQDQVQSCGGLLTTSEGRLSFPHDTNPELYRDNMNCVWVLRPTGEPGKVLNLTFTRFHLEGYPGSRCVHDSLSIQDGSDLSAPLIGAYCGDALPNGGNIISTHDALYLKFASDHSIVGLGFEFSWNVTDPVCGGLVTNATHGSINSPGYPGNYPHNRDCEWLLQVSPGKRIQLVFASFRIETHPNCSFDYFQVRDGIEESAQILAFYCNTTLPPPIISSGPYLAIRFHTDDSATDLGFHITWAEVPGIPGCGGVLTGNIGGFSSPQHPEPYGHLLECDWLIRLPTPEDRVALHFNTFELEGAHNCRYDFVEIHDGPSPTSPLVGRWCGSSIPPDFKSSSSQLLVKFRSDDSVAYGGFSAKYETICGGVFTELEGILRSPYYPNSYPANRECIFLLSLPPGKAILLDFMDFDIESPHDERCQFDYLEVRDGDTENSTLLGHFCGPPTLTPDRILSTHNYLWIKFKTDSSIQNKGFYANYSTIDTGCGGILRDSHGVINSPGHPEIYPHGVQCTWIIRGLPGQAVRLTWVSFSLEAASYGGSTCGFDFVQVFDNSTYLPNGTSIGRFCGHNTPPVLTSSDNTMTIVFQSDHSVAHDGFMANFVLINTSTVCGGEFFSEYGVIRSPRYPQFYPNRKSCEWTLRVGNGQQIRLNISDFDLERGSGSRCNYDYLEIRNGAYSTSPLIGKYCGNVQPPQIIPSHSNSLHLKFVSDHSHAGRGFLITWDGTQTGCGGSLTSPSGSIISPNYPSPYGVRTECTWTISVNQGSALQLVFVDLDIQQHSSSCWNEYVELRDGRDARAPLLGKYCHSDSVFTVNSTGNLVWIKFLSGYGASGRGFQLNYRATCNRVIKGFHGVIESPNFPAAYPHNRNCTWELQATRGNKLNVSFSHFDIEAPLADNCHYDFVEAKEWTRFGYGEVSKTSLGKFCGSTPPPLITSTKETLSINFVSDYSHALNGFRLEWRVHGCGGRLIGSYHSIRSPNYPARYANNVECIWHITTELGTKVELNIYELDIERAENCIFDALIVYGGSDENSPKLATICHSSSTSSVTVLTSHGNNMYIKFISDGSVPAKGFYGSARSVPGGCGGRIKAPSGFVYSPNYPSNYDHDDDCGWLIEVDRNHAIVLQFMDFNVERHINCSYDHVAIYDGGSSYDPLLLMHCGSEMPDPGIIRSSGSRMYIRLKTDGSSASRGFKANFTTGCGARITPSSSSRSSRYDFNRAFSRRSQTSGTITSPHYPSIVLPKTNCTWILTAPGPEERVTFTMTNLDWAIQEDTNCSERFVEVLDGEDGDAPSLGRFCGTVIPPSLTSRGNSLVIKLQTGRYYGGHGFRGVYDFASSACGSTTTLTSMNGSFTSPNFPNGYPPNMECVHEIKVAEGNKVQLSFRRFELESSDYCNNDFVEIHESDAEGRLLGHFCGSEIPSNLTAARSLWILFRTDGEGQAPGFWADYNFVHGNELSGSYGVIESPGYPVLNSLTGTFSWRISVNESKAVEISFTEADLVPFSDDPADCSGYNRIIIYDGFDDQAPVLLTVCTSSSLPALSSTGNVVYIRFMKMYWNGKFRLVWNEIQAPNSEEQLATNITGCGGNYSISEGNFTTLLSPNYPNAYPHSIRCEWLIDSPPHTRIHLQVEDFDMEANVNCFWDKLEVYDGRLGLPNYVLNATLCHRTQINGSLVSSGRFLKLVMITDSNTAMPGFNLTLSTVCGGYSREPRGKITSPGYPGNYIPSLCDWSVIVRPGRTIRTLFEFLDIYGEGGCVTDELILRNGGSTDSPFLGAGRYCGTTVPSLPETSGNQLHVSFRAWTSNRRGFSLIYEEVGAGCGGEIYLTDGAPGTILSSPNFPQIPPPFTECVWLISVPQGEAVSLTFQISFDFDLSTPGCRNAGIEIRDGGTSISNLIGTYCRIMPGTLKSTGNIMFVRYYTNVPEPRTGFKAEVKIATCGGLLTGYNGRIQSPGYPGSYDTNLDCLWTIRSPPGTIISIRFQDLELGSSPIPVTLPPAISPESGDNSTASAGQTSSGAMLCPVDKDRIFITEPNITGGGRGGDVQYPRNWTICSNLGYIITSRSNELSLRFISDGRRETLKGFKLTYYSRHDPCGGTFRSPTGIIQTPNYPNPHPHSRYCTWRIFAPQDRRIRLEFLDFDMEETYTSRGIRFCYDYVSLYQGRIGNYRLYNRTLCGPTLPDPVETTSNELNVYFGSDNSVAHRGFKARYTTDLPLACGGLLPPGNGTLLSPNISTGTPITTTNALCQWTTTTPGESGGSTTNGTTIITISSLRIPPFAQAGDNDPNCPRGFVRFSPVSTYYRGNWKKWCGYSTSPRKIYVPGNTVQIDYEAAFLNSTFSLEYKVSPCGGRLVGPMDNVSSLGYPTGYPVSTECIWILEYSPASQIRLRFLDLDLDDHRSNEGCDRDYLLIRNGIYQTSPILGKFCGSSPPPDIISMSSHLWIEFHSDENSDPGRRGFQLSAEKIERGCGGIIHRKYGKLVSPSVQTGSSGRRPGGSSARGRYPPNTECEWTIESVPGYTINLLFDGRFDIEQSANCSNDFVEVFSKYEDPAALDVWKPLGRFCGRQLPAGINTTSSSIKVRFISNQALDGDGFALVWYSPCGGVFTAPSGIIRSAHYDRHNHSSSLNQENYWSFIGWEATWRTARCDYVILAGSPEDYIVLEFLPPLDIYVPASYGARNSELESSCPEVNLTVWSGNATSRPAYTSVVCGSNAPPPPAFVGSGAVTISYNYRAQYQNEGFSARYSVFRCGGTVTQPSIIASPGHPFTSAPHMNCTWIVRAPPGRVVRFRFETLELEFHNRCQYDYVKLFNGARIDEERKIGTWCGNMTEDFHPLISTGTELTIQFSTDWIIQHGGFSGVVDFTAGEPQGCGGIKNVTGQAAVVIQSVVAAGGGGLYEAMLDCQWLVSGPEFQALELTFETFNLEGGGRSPGKNVSSNPGDPCPYDYIELRDGPGPFAQNLGKFCGSAAPPTPISSSNNFMWIRFVSDSSYNFPGFRARIVSRESPCGRTFVLNATTSVQTLTSPGYGSSTPYGPNIRCKWTIDGESFFDEVDIKFIDMDITSSPGCAQDKLEIKDVSSSYTSPEGVGGGILFIGNGPVDWRHRNLGLTDEILQDIRYCGSQTPPDFFSIGRSAELVFHSDSDGTAAGRGFKIEYKAAGCNRTYENRQGRIFSPEYPGYSPFYFRCSFSIRAPGNGTFISMYFNKFLLPGATAVSLECTESVMEIRDGTPNGRILAKLCGSSRPDPIFSYGNVIWVRYVTGLALSRGYDISYTTTTAGRGCGGDLFHTGGSFTSPLYPGNYSQNSDCRWRVRVPAGLVVQITFTDFLIGGDCSTDFLELLSADSHTPSAPSILFSRFCAGDTISVYTGTTDVVEIRYKTSVNNTGAGWRATFKGITPTRLPPQSQG